MNFAARRRLEELVAAGCAVGVDGNPGQPVADAWVDALGNVCWASLIPEDQHHVHVIDATDTGLVVDGRDLVVDDTDGRRWYFAPVAEWGEIDPGMWQDTWSQWQAVRRAEAKRAGVLRLYNAAVGSAPAA